MAQHSLNWTQHNTYIKGRCLVEMPNGDRLMQWRYNGNIWTSWKYPQNLQQFAKRFCHATNYDASAIIAFEGTIADG